MIRFNCHQCGRPFTVREQDAGRRARCKDCGAEVTVPAPSAATLVGAGAPAHAAGESAGDAQVGSAATKASEAPRRIPMRIRRLNADAEQMAAAFKDFPAIKVVAMQGDPPELYRLEYNVKSLERGKKPNQPVPRDNHLVEIQLTSEYPRQSPKCRLLTPIFHPNIDPATICVGDHWAAGERLVDLAVRIGEMLAFQAYNIKSPLDAEAAMWADLHTKELPTDSRDMRPADLE
jgi:ubiquitin-protein ligase/DNA-directed RNA polymerase subunit RPC12/RpoP